MAGRALAFSDPEIIKMAAEEFVPVTGDDWYQRRRQDEEGRFFRHAADQACRGREAPDGGDTRQGIYTLTAGGRLLYWQNAGQSPDDTRSMLHSALDAWRALPESERRPGAVKVEDLAADQRFTRTPPSGGLILRSFTRALDGDAATGFRAGGTETYGVQNGPQHDHVWLTKPEWNVLVPTDPRVGSEFEVPPSIVLRIFRYHLVDGTAGEPTFWSRDQVRSGTITLTVERVTGERVRLRLDGNALLATADDIRRADRGYDARLLGYLEYNSVTRALERFDVVAVGNAWGPGAAGRRLLGVAFELAPGDVPADRVPPSGARLEDYFSTASGRVGVRSGLFRVAAVALLLLMTVLVLAAASIYRSTIYSAIAQSGTLGASAIHQ